MDTLAIFFLFATGILMLALIASVYILHKATEDHSNYEDKLIEYIRELEEQLNEMNKEMK